jgi:hypothetical protein
MATNQQLQNALDALNANPMFHMSLASKELFHSNFLYWLWKLDASKFLTLLDKLSECKDYFCNMIDTIEVKREYQHFDLCVLKKGTNEVLLVIENKVKSIPYVEQLNEYTGKLDPRCKKVLLTLMQEFPDKNNISGWKIKHYNDLADAISESYVDTEYQTFIDHYLEFIKQLNGLVKEWLDDYENRKLVLLNEDIHNAAYELRLHDLYGKLYYSIMACEINDRLSKEGLLNGWGRQRDKKISAKAEYTKVQPMITIAIPEVYNEAEFCIQIQGNHYRHAIARPNAKFEDVKNEFEQYKDVCDFWWTEKYTKKFTHFGGFIYKYWKLKRKVAKNQFEETNIDELKNHISEDLTNLKEQISKW